ncbi:hypothetical protein [Thalassotalea sp. G20_0]|nr:hypothetical protein [Thalassotalea sp. G20_0]
MKTFNFRSQKNNVSAYLKTSSEKRLRIAEKDKEAPEKENHEIR